MTQVIKVTSKRVEEMQRDPQEYFRKARELTRRRAVEQLRAEQQRARRNRQLDVQARRGQRLAAG